MKPSNFDSKIKITIIASDISRNSLGRAYMLAEALSAKYSVTLIGPAYEESNYAIWEPVKNSTIPIQSFNTNNTLELYDQLKSLASGIDTDVVITCKPRMPSYYLGLLIKQQKNVPLILDIDDYELSFFGDQATEISNKDLLKPKGKTWSILAELIIHYADQIFVSNPALQKKYGGTVIPHARDEIIFNPAKYNKATSRKDLGIALEDKIALFMGTPREHKGLKMLLEAIKGCKDNTFKLCIIGSFPDNNLKEELMALAGDRLILIPSQPFQDIPKNVAIADLICLMQDPGNETAKYQLPAKAIDAIAMGIPVLASRTEPLESLIQQGLIIPTSEKSLSEDLIQAFNNASGLQKKQLANRSIFLTNYSYRAILNNMDQVIASSQVNLKPLPDNIFTFIDTFSSIIKEKQDLSIQLKKQTQIIKRQERTVKRQEQKIDNLETSLQTILNSNSWKITSPLRKIGQLFNKPAQK